ncbi:PREDICTED: U-box domain-containing protein 21-like [Nelumbo nucifera]|uniref:U-box domain-containing protein n=2 Tax=Nelumbo nucifera TaxID=4432 RepID=A0A1U8B4Y9_NELNU|nr:PREDICTED: U-box domain-containing protein 21-like [Nelumbo nucifera]DAD32297.1 TPA_asm: hypothetical protein HUJ06_011148 [Nelumbo nucifera]
MISNWRKRRASRRAGKTQKQPGGQLDMEVTIPTHFRCPISLELMKDPVTLSTGITYDRESIERWIESGNQTCPVTNKVLTSFEPTPNHAIRKMIQDWCVKNRSLGIERIPTPRIPVTPVEVLELLSRITDAAWRGDQSGCGELVAKIKRLGKENERNKRCIVGNGAGRVLAAAFDAFAAASFEKNVAALEKILSAMPWMLPLDSEAQSYLASPASLRCMVWFLNSGSLSGRQNAVLVLKELLSSDQKHVSLLAEIEGANQALVKLIKEPICPTATKASLVAIFQMVSPSNLSSSDRIKSGFVEMGLVSLLLDILVDSDKSLCEKALGVLDGLCSCQEAREKAYSNALTMPVLVKKILRISDLATEFSVSILWKLCKNRNPDEGSIVIEALQVGAFQKLLLLLQVGCGEGTKEKATELLKLLNLYRGKLECIDSTDFKDLKRPF